MTVKEAEIWNPTSQNYLDAFNVAQTKHPHLTSGKIESYLQTDRGVREVAQYASDLITAGVAFLANNTGDKRIGELGTVAWWGFNREVFQIAFANSTSQALALMQLQGYPIATQQIEHARVMPSEHQLAIFGDPKRPFSKIGEGFIFLPPAFVLRCLKDPIGSLARIAHMSSSIRDYLNHRMDGRETAEQITQRAYAYEAQVV